MVNMNTAGRRKGCKGPIVGTMKRLRILGQDGFSLVEIAIVLVVVGLLVSGGLLGLAPVLDSSKVAETNAKMDKIEQALLVYVMQYKCLPCPASPAATVSGQAQDTNGSYNGATYITSCNSNNDSGSFACANGSSSRSQGPVPWINLGLSRDDVLDAYGNYIDYVVTSSSTTGLNLNHTSMVRTPPTTYPTGQLSVQNTANSPQTSAAAYLLISHGKDKSYAYHPGSAAVIANPNEIATSNAQGCNTLPQVNCNTNLTAGSYVVDKAQGTSATTGYFDDIVRYKTGPIIIQGCGSNACGNPA